MNDPKDKIIKGLTERVNELEAQLHDALLAEREACAKLMEEVGRQTAAAIRARSKHD